MNMVGLAMGTIKAFEPWQCRVPQFGLGGMRKVLVRAAVQNYEWDADNVCPQGSPVCYSRRHQREYANLSLYFPV